MPQHGKLQPMKGNQDHRAPCRNFTAMLWSHPPGCNLRCWCDCKASQLSVSFRAWPLPRVTTKWAAQRLPPANGGDGIATHHLAAVPLMGEVGDGIES
jgi:hypothetical protein